HRYTRLLAPPQGDLGLRRPAPAVIAHRDDHRPERTQIERLREEALRLHRAVERVFLDEQDRKWLRHVAPPHRKPGNCTNCTPDIPGPRGGPQGPEAESFRRRRSLLCWPGARSA